MRRTVGPLRARHDLVAGLALALCLPLLPQCSTAPRPAPAPAPTPAVAEVAQPAAPTINLDDRPLPEGALLGLRIGPPRALAARLGAHLGLGDLLGELLTDALPGMVQDDEAVARAVDLDAPIDALVVPRRLRLGMTLAMGTGELSRVRAVLSDGHTLDTYGAADLGAWRVARSRDDLARSTLFLAAASQPAGGGRWVLAERAPQDDAAFAGVVGYLTRTAARRPYAATEGALQAEVHLGTVRASMLEDMRREAGRSFARVVRDLAPADPPAEDQGLGWLRAWFDAVPTTASELTALRAALHLPDTGARVEAVAEMGAPSAGPVQQLLEAVQASAPPLPLLQRLPPGGVAYGATALSLAPFRTTLNVLPDAALRALLPRTRLNATDATALRTALAALTAQENLAVAATAGRDPQGRAWQVAHLQLTTPAAQFVSNVRAVVTQLRRLPVARAVRADQQFDPATVQVLPTTGLPAGSLLVRVPDAPAWLRGELLASRTAAPTAGRAAGARPAGPPVEILLAPDGPRVWWVVAADARARLRASMGDHPAPVATEGLLGDVPADVRAVVAVMPSLGPELVRDDARMARLLTEALGRAGADAQTPSVLRVLVQQTGDLRRLRASLEVPQRVLSLVARSFQQQ